MQMHSSRLPHCLYFQRSGGYSAHRPPWCKRAWYCAHQYKNTLSIYIFAVFVTLLNTKANNIAPDDSVGKIYARNDKSRTIGFGHQAYDDVNRSILSAFYEDEKEITRIDLIPNNRFQTEGNCKITDIRVDYTKPIWQLIVEVWIDGTLYAKSINFNG